ncbi:NAD(P)/FAD-dependent oxidoreductase [Kitasatospora herbaricolor]|uniref:NAD(P)/FAD-dependent oxidoreductase n=1 Tax=Kitasatospora herbaricolor TaxID=68217 RepID=A0ABZ1W1U8_9ACTN|nr:NAD(P)/FAD-dependent oxidoreductase [Kitasatospora herbaricolor]
MGDRLPTEHVDVLVVGAGISGIGAGRYLQQEHGGKSFAVLEARAAAGGTWDLFRYPGVRSDSDLQTFGYEFKPWRDQEAIAAAPRILAYLRETVAENGLEPHIRYQQRVLGAAWSSETARWTVEVLHTGTGERTRLTAGWIFCAGGYYRYDQGFTPVFEGRERFAGDIVHPQHWPQDLDHTGKRVVVIGSGATAVTLVPAMAETAEHVTMLQRTPSYIMALPRRDALANRLQKVFGPERGYALARRRNIAIQRLAWRLLRRFPNAGRRYIRFANARLLPEDYPVDEHFNPPYDPWDQRLCLAPDGDLFTAIREGRASVVTETITGFTETGVLLASGRELPADVVVTATGLNLQVFGGIALTVDGREVSFPETVAYRGMMLGDLPNFAFAIGYTNSSWTLKVGLVCEYFCRLLRHMDEHGYDTARAVPGPGMPTRPFLDFDAGYVRRSLADLPRQGTTSPWLMSMSYQEDRKLLRAGAVTDEFLQFSGPGTRSTGSARSAGRPAAHARA